MSWGPDHFGLPVDAEKNPAECPGVLPDTEAEPAWHRPLGKKALECRLFPETGAEACDKASFLSLPGSQSEKPTQAGGEPPV